MQSKSMSASVLPFSSGRKSRVIGRPGPSASSQYAASGALLASAMLSASAAESTAATDAAAGGLAICVVMGVVSSMAAGVSAG